MRLTLVRHGETTGIRFEVATIDEATRIAAGATRSTILRSIDGHIVAEERLMGKYSR